MVRAGATPAAWVRQLSLLLLFSGPISSLAFFISSISSFSLSQFVPLFAFVSILLKVAAAAWGSWRREHGKGRCGLGILGLTTELWMR
jgi:hypothetical protein